ncbi:MAG: hypothetical protein H6868_07985 [Rhodospirillales bacterium]|nr:hypothetical protein [Rhodospirillales bacterium]
MTKKMQAITPEWSHLFDVEDVAAVPVTLTITADEQQCRDLARRLGVEAVQSAAATVTLQRQNGNIIHVKGDLTAQVIQNCVVTLEPFEEQIEEDVEGWYLDEEQAVSLAKVRHERQSRGGEVEVPILDERDDPEPVVDGMIDLGELATQCMSLAINPFPHAPGVMYELGDDRESPVEPPRQPNPFAALKEWKKNKEEN